MMITRDVYKINGRNDLAVYYMKITIPKGSGLGLVSLYKE